MKGRHAILYTPRIGREIYRGFTKFKMRPLLPLERGARAVVTIDYDWALDPGAILDGMTMDVSGCRAALRFSERTAVLDVWGSQAWLPWWGQDYGLGWNAPGIELAALFSTGEILKTRLLVRAPNRLDWMSGGDGGTAGVTDMRGAQVYTTAPQTIIGVADLTATGAGQSEYVVTEFPDLGSDFEH